jgi:hypothetical protein
MTRPSANEVFEFYRSSGFLYPAKLAALEPRLATIMRTWSRLLAAQPDVFHFVGRYGVHNGFRALKSTACAYQYALGTWQGQHLVSASRGDYAGTLGVLIELIEWCHDTGAAYARAHFRPSNPGVSELMGSVAERLPTHLASLSLIDYGIAAVEAIDLDDERGPAVDVRPLRNNEIGHIGALYAQTVAGVELASLHLDDPWLNRLDAHYRSHALMRRRTPLVATEGSRIVGACLVNHGSEGMNLSFLENAIEYVHVARELATARRERVWRALVRAAVKEVRQTRDYVVTALDPEDRALGVAAGLLPPSPKQYGVLTVSRREQGLLRGIECWREYYETRSRRASEAAA